MKRPGKCAISSVKTGEKMFVFKYRYVYMHVLYALKYCNTDIDTFPSTDYRLTDSLTYLLPRLVLAFSLVKLSLAFASSSI